MYYCVSCCTKNPKEISYNLLDKTFGLMMVSNPDDSSQFKYWIIAFIFLIYLKIYDWKHNINKYFINYKIEKIK